jgi:hypothetical protein
LGWQFGANIKNKDNNNERPLDIAFKKNNAPLYLLLKQFYEDKNVELRSSAQKKNNCCTSS